MRYLNVILAAALFAVAYAAPLPEPTAAPEPFAMPMPEAEPEALPCSVNKGSMEGC